MNKLLAFVESTDVPDDARNKIIGMYLDGIGDEWRKISGSDQPYTSLKYAIQWVESGELSEKQLCSKYSRKKKEIIDMKDPFFEKGIHWQLYKSVVYLSKEGLSSWVMAQSSPLACLIRARFAHIISRDDRSKKVTPAKRRKFRSPIKHTPKKIKYESSAVSNVSHTVLDKLVEALQNNSQVYFIWDGLHFKIGITVRKVQKRVTQLQTGSSRTLTVHDTILTENPRRLEKYLHDVYKEQHVRGEWFAITADEVNSIVKFLKG